MTIGLSGRLPIQLTLPSRIIGESKAKFMLRLTLRVLSIALFVLSWIPVVVCTAIAKTLYAKSLPPSAIRVADQNLLHLQQGDVSCKQLEIVQADEKKAFLSKDALKSIKTMLPETLVVPQGLFDNESPETCDFYYVQQKQEGKMEQWERKKRIPLVFLDKGSNWKAQCKELTSTRQKIQVLILKNILPDEKKICALLETAAPRAVLLAHEQSWTLNSLTAEITLKEIFAEKSHPTSLKEKS